MTDRVLEKYTRHSAAQADSRAEGDPVETADLGCFGWLRGIRDRAIMLELRKRDGCIKAFGYAWLERIDYDPAQGITLLLPGQRIQITGVGLNTEIRPFVRLFEGLTRHRVPWVCETPGNRELQSAVSKIAVDRIAWDD